MVLLALVGQPCSACAKKQCACALATVAREPAVCHALYFVCILTALYVFCLICTPPLSAYCCVGHTILSAHSFTSPLPGASLLGLPLLHLANWLGLALACSAGEPACATPACVPAVLVCLHVSVLPRPRLPYRPSSSEEAPKQNFCLFALRPCTVIFKHDNPYYIRNSATIVIFLFLRKIMYTKDSTLPRCRHAKPLQWRVLRKGGLVRVACDRAGRSHASK